MNSFYGFHKFVLQFYQLLLILVLEPTDGQPLKKIFSSGTATKVDMILPLGDFTIYAEIMDNFGTYINVEIGTVSVRI